MSVVSTDQWLLKSHDDPINICKNIEKLFDGASAYDIYEHLTNHGMYHLPLKNGADFIKKLQKKDLWKIVRKEELKLRKLWNGPDIPVFIFPSESSNPELKRYFNGKSGLSFADKLFLFVSEENSVNEIKALFTHEYNHVCRLSQSKKKEEDYVLLDTIILEGLAECAVFEQLSNEYTAQWTSYYSAEELEGNWKQHIYPARNLPKHSYSHQEILYGLSLYPKMVGYCVGYYLVKKFMNKNRLTSKDLLPIPSNTIAQVQKKKFEY